MKRKTIITILIAFALALVLLNTSESCTRILYETGSKGFIVGRTMDWYDDTGTDLWAFPRGMERNGGAGPGSIKWTSKYGSVV